MRDDTHYPYQGWNREYNYRSYSDPVVIKRIIREYYKEFYSHKFDTLEEIDQFLKKH